MEGVASLIQRITAVVTADSLSRADFDSLEALFKTLLDFGCAAADDDLVACGEEGLELLKRAREAEDLAEMKEQLGEYAAALATAYAEDQPPQASETVAMGSDHSDPTLQGVPEVPAAVEPNAPESERPAPVPLVDAAMAAANLSLREEESEEDELRDPEILAEFVIEANEHLSEAEGHLLALETDPTDKAALGALFRGFHTIKGLAGFLAFPEVERLAHAAEDLLALARDERDRLPAGASDLIFEAADCLQRSMEAIKTAFEAGEAPRGIAAPQLIERIKTLWSETRGPASVAGGPPVPEAIPRPSDDPTDSEPSADLGSDAPGVELGFAKVPGPDEPRTNTGQAGGSRAKRETIRVDAERLDRLVDMVGELVITESMVTRGVGELSAASSLVRHLGRMDKITRELHELAGSLRMIPVRSTFRKMARLARDVARKSGKRVSFEVHGEEAELDKTLVDRIGDPLVHMVRNAIDHGLEPNPEARVAAGKPPVGNVTLRALHRGGSIYIEVEDDGRGLDPEKILSRAEERGLIRPGEILGKRDIIRLICEPGFSTAEQITSISGRGVGMDVVRQQIEAMNGSLEVESELGRGTCFSMQLPLTLAVIDGMVMRVGEDRFVVPTLSVVRLVQPGSTNICTVLGRGEVLRLGDHLVPVARPDELFEIELDRDRDPMAIVVEVDHGQVAMLVDELLGQQQVVIKSLGEGLGDVPGIAGCAIMPDGRVGLVLDIGGIVRRRQAGLSEPPREVG